MYTYLLLTIGILIQLAAATAEKGTNLVTNGGIFCIKVFIFIYLTKAKKTTYKLHTVFNEFKSLSNF